MRLGPLAVMFVVASVAAGCKTKDGTPRDADSSLIPDTSGSALVIPGGPADLGMVFKCKDIAASPKEVSFTMRGWRTRLERKQTIRWLLIASGQDYITFTKVDKNAPWPFVDSANLVLKDGGTLVSYRPDTPAQDTIFHYNVIGVCKRGGLKEDTVVIDPIMILPN